MRTKRPHAEGLALRDLREAHGVSRKELAQALGLKNDDLLAKYERGDREMSRETLDWAVAPLGLFPEAVDAQLFAHRLILPDSPTEPGLTPEELRRIDRTALAVAWTAAQTVRPALIRRKKEQKAAAERQEAEEALAHLLTCPPADRRDLVTVYPRFRSCALVAVVCDASEQAAAHRVADAMELAGLAEFIAERVPGGEPRRLRASGYARGVFANAQRVANWFDEADATFGAAWKLWNAGSAIELDPLAEWRLLDLEASLRREQHRFSEALMLLGSASRGADATAKGRILLKKANVLQQEGDFSGAAVALKQAAPAIESSRDRHLLFALRFNTSAVLRHLGHYEEAAALLPEVRELAVEQGNELSVIRVLWLSAWIAAAQGRVEEAIASLEQVRGEFMAQELPYEAALSSLDLAVLWLERGRLAEVRQVALGMVWIFKSKKVHREALAALAIFCEAARDESATLELTRQVIAEVHRAMRSTSPRQVEIWR
jgi:transcriptional regulator with XRE-family HTH domain/tetratricopeptide (TPR) repeat protein